MNKREAAREAKIIAAAQIDAYLEVGQPYDDHGCEALCVRCNNVRDALLALSARLDPRVVTPEGPGLHHRPRPRLHAADVGRAEHSHHRPRRRSRALLRHRLDRDAPAPG